MEERKDNSAWVEYQRTQIPPKKKTKIVSMKGPIKGEFIINILGLRPIDFSFSENHDGRAVTLYQITNNTMK